jgi:hypothetical protein
MDCAIQPNFHDVSLRMATSIAQAMMAVTMPGDGTGEERAVYDE